MKINLSNAVISKIATLADKSVRVWLDLPETNTEELSALISNLQNDVHEVEFELDEEGGKSPSHRLRDRMFVYYKEKFKKTEGFTTWYIEALEKIGQSYLDKLT